MDKQNKFYVYRHIRLDSDTPFYVGKGHGKRAFCKFQRNSLWSNIAKKAGFEVEILMSDLDEDAAFDKEKEFISLYKNFGYKLANFTSGGEGVSGLRHTEEAKEKTRKANKGKRYSPGTEFKKGKTAPTKGTKLTMEHREKLSQTKLKMFADISIHPRSRQVVDSDGNTWPSMKSLCLKYGWPQTTILRYVKSGKEYKGLTMKFVEKTNGEKKLG